MADKMVSFYYTIGKDEIIKTVPTEWFVGGYEINQSQHKRTTISFSDKAKEAGAPEHIELGYLKVDAVAEKINKAIAVSDPAITSVSMSTVMHVPFAQRPHVIMARQMNARLKTNSQ